MGVRVGGGGGLVDEGDREMWGRVGWGGEGRAGGRGMGWHGSSRKDATTSQQSKRETVCRPLVQLVYRLLRKQTRVQPLPLSSTGSAEFAKMERTL